MSTMAPAPGADAATQSISTPRHRDSDAQAALVQTTVVCILNLEAIVM